ncbi:oxidoreductase [Microbacterium testaceum]|uniref:Oxidoreductase n=1 Tax=Microbacterium testaceum TaxID=2033 RepID=A0A147EWR9_MICTE|nr:SDR family oxidoreductase [Microbacterium testaceum]KTR94254.1 oxidoreductase [Microbacterium testaceum]
MDQPAHVTAITGASRGIGAAVARRLAAEGHGVVIGYRRDRDAAVAVATDVAELGGAASVAYVDVTDAASLTAFFDSAAELGPLTGVVASAGAVRAVGDLRELTPDDLRRDIDVNLLGAVLTAQASIVHLEKTRGSLVFIGSAAATLGSPNTYVHYTAAKAGVSALSLGLSKELAPLGIRVNCVEPGIIRTEFHRDPDRPEKLASTIPLGRPGDAAEVTGAVAWLLSEDAGYVTEATIRVAGGR